MPKYRFTAVERFAIYSAHGEHCYLCSRLVYPNTMVVDHLIPEFLLGDPERLAQAKKDLGLPDDFSINSYENWLPACSSCNAEKRDTIFNPSLLLQARLKRASEKAATARELAAQIIGNRRISRALNTLVRAGEKGELRNADRAEFMSLALYLMAQRDADRIAEPVWLAPNYAVALEIEFIGGCRNGEILKSGSDDLDAQKSKWLLLLVGSYIANAKKENKTVDCLLKWQQPIPELVQLGKDEGWSTEQRQERMRYHIYHVKDYEESGNAVRFKAVYRGVE